MNLKLQKMKASVHLVFPNTPVSVVPEGSTQGVGEPLEHGMITSVTQGAMSGILCTKHSYFPLFVIENLHVCSEFNRFFILEFL